MTKIEKISCFPNEGEPQVIAGEPAAGDLVRITTDSGAVICERYTPPVILEPPQPPAPTTKEQLAKLAGDLQALIAGLP